MIGVDVFNYGHLFESNEVYGPIRPCPCPEDYGVSMHPDCCEFVPEDQQPDLDGDGTPDISDANPNDPDIQTQEQQAQDEQGLNGANGNGGDDSEDAGIVGGDDPSYLSVVNPYDINPATGNAYCVDYNNCPQQPTQINSKIISYGILGLIGVVAVSMIG